MTDFPPEPTPNDLSDFMSALKFNIAMQSESGPTFQDTADAHPDVIARLAKMDPAHSATSLGSLLTVPDLQANCFRIEMLVHLALMAAKGHDKMSDVDAEALFQEVGKGFCGHMEDPAEDVFVSMVRTPRGNFRTLEGIWEGNTFYLQRLLNAMEAMPTGTAFDELRNDVYALLTVSDLICERAQLERHQLGAEWPTEQLSAKKLGSLSSKTQRIRFSITELEQLGIEPLMLAPFLFSPSDCARLGAERLGNSSLERRPLIRMKDELAVLLPTAISAAIRYYIIERMEAPKMRAALGRSIAHEYAQHLSKLHYLVDGAGGQSHSNLPSMVHSLA